MNLVKVLVSSYFLCLFGGYFVYAELTIDVTNTTCGQTYYISEYEKIILKYEEKDNVNVTFSISSCVFNIVNYDYDKELCIKQTKAGAWGFITCASIFKYFTGYLPPSHNGGISCRDFENAPLCTGYSNVYAVFKDQLTFIKNSLTIEIYWRNMIVTTTSRMRTTTYYSNYDNSEKTDVGLSIGIVVMIVIVVFVICTVCGIGCKIAREHTNERDAVESPVQYTQQSVPQVSVQPANAADAPSYESLFQQQQQPPSNEGATEWQIHDRVCGGVSPSQRHLETHPSHHNSLETDLASDPPVEDQTIPTAPPPSYADLGFPPAYPGNA